ncbi:DUF2938 family protein [Rapidithrix thailandica]|uniref:DUF2938 family protein n=1 Tax=Rapidithrix thailandica TaxID=413964 RepID=A0AAW9SC29_9BACT
MYTLFLRVVVIGLGGTLCIDLFTTVLGFFKVTTNGLRFVGRYIAYALDGIYVHNTIIQTGSATNELVYGYIVHYIAGISFAFLLLLFFTKEWLYTPKFLPALVVGLVSYLPALFIIQPLFGFGFAFSELDRQVPLLFKTSIIHIIYGIGLYCTARLVLMIEHRNKIT